MRRFFAPGKVVLLGEYAVLDGAPALVAAVDRGVACEVRPGPFAIVTPPGTDDRFVAPALQAVDAPEATYVFHDAPPQTTRDKPGLGSSAAATVVAMVAGSAMRGERMPPEALHRRAHEVHHRVQGSGSGIDVAAASHGGVIRFEGGKVTPRPQVAFRVAYSGTSAKTGPRVQRYLAWPDRAGFVQASTTLVDHAHRDLPGALREAGDRLGAMAEAAGIAYWTTGLRRLCHLASVHGGGAKPSGAGGGDIVVAAFPTEGQADAWSDAAAAEGFTMIPTRLAPGAQEA